MVFSSIPVYLDPPNWHQQQQNHQHTLASSETAPQLPPLPPPQLHHGAPGSVGPSSAPGSIRPGSMADRARMANIPQPEAALKCPRCESTNTKFCYFNNYSLSQPRHFCKTCRRYWTRGGALRNVPVGGGCRRNKKSKSSSNNNSRSKSPASNNNSAEKQQTTPVGPNSNAIPPGAELIGHFSQPQSHSSFMASIQNLARFGGGAGNLGLNFNADIGFPVGPAGNNSNDQSGVILHGGGGGGETDQWRLQQFTLLGGTQDFDQSSAGFFPLIQGTSSTNNAATDHHQAGAGEDSCQIRMNMASSGTSRVSQFPVVKLEGRPGLNLSSRPPGLGISENNHNFWGGNSNTTSTGPWTDLSGLNSSSSASHLL